MSACPTDCDDDCAADCHEFHYVKYKRSHDPAECPAVDTSGWTERDWSYAGAGPRAERLKEKR